MRLWPVFVLLTILTIHAPSFAQTDSTPIAPVILFVHGWCTNADDWQSVELKIAQSLHARYPNIYPDASQGLPTTYVTFYDYRDDVWFQEISPVPSPATHSVVDKDARFFRVAFVPDDYDYQKNDYNYFSNDKQGVAEISILNKAAELANIIQAIRSEVGIRPVIIISHSLGGVVLRAMLEDLHGVYSSVPGAKGDTLLAVQLDTPNRPLGGDVQTLATALLPTKYRHCVERSSSYTTNFAELTGVFDTIDQINSPSSLGNYPRNIPLVSLVNVAVPQGIQNSYEVGDVLYYAIQLVTGEWNDGIVPQSAQDITNITGTTSVFSSLISYIDEDYLVGGNCTGLNAEHFLSCLVDQQQVMTNLNAAVGTAAGKAQAILAIVGPRNRLFVNTLFPLQVRVGGLTSITVDWSVIGPSGASVKSCGVGCESFMATTPGTYRVIATTHDPFCVLDNCSMTLQDSLLIQVFQPGKPTFSISAAPQIDTVIQGQTASFTLTAQSQGGFSSAITPVAWGLPRGVSAGWSPPTLTLPPDGSVTSTLTILTSQATTPGSYRMRIRASAQGQRTQEVTVIARVAKPSSAPIWPMSGHDPQRTGLSQFAGPDSSPGPPLWTFATGAPVVGDLSISSEGIIYFGSDRLYALNPDGTTYAPPASISGIAAGPAIDDNSGYVYIPVIAPPGYDLLRFTKQLTGQTTVMHIPQSRYDYGISAPIIAPDGTVYLLSGGYPATLYSIGSSTWQNSVCPFAMGSFGTKNAPTLGVDGTVYIMCEGDVYQAGGGLYKLDKTTGTTLAFYGYSRGASELVIDKNQIIHAGFEAFGGIFYLGSYDTWDGKLNHLSGNWMDYTTGRASLFPDGSSTIRPGYSSGLNNTIAAEGAHSWEVDADGSTIPDFSSVPSVDAVGTVYVGNTTGVIAYRNDGSAAWSYSTADTITTQPVISNNGALYVGSSSGNVYAFQVIAGNQGAVSTSASPTVRPTKPARQPSKPTSDLSRPRCGGCPSEK